MKKQNLYIFPSRDTFYNDCFNSEIYFNMNSNILHKYERILPPLLVIVWGKISFH